MIEIKFKIKMNKNSIFEKIQSLELLNFKFLFDSFSLTTGLYLQNF